MLFARLAPCSLAVLSFDTNLDTTLDTNFNTNINTTLNFTLNSNLDSFNVAILIRDGVVSYRRAKKATSSVFVREVQSHQPLVRGVRVVELLKPGTS